MCTRQRVRHIQKTVQVFEMAHFPNLKSQQLSIKKCYQTDGFSLTPCKWDFLQCVNLHQGVANFPTAVHCTSPLILQLMRLGPSVAKQQTKKQKQKKQSNQ